ncbi:MAG: glycosyltransferase family 2 protein [Nanoarchaeota archaeon]|nr:glycosyltransferase family 2 protein [Nanoarchaeota archaeon]
MTLSIIIPVYNEKKTILEILKKIEQVNLNDFSFGKEIIIVDDGSTDGTTDILKKTEKKYKVIYQYKNLGKGTAIRAALKEVSGDYVIIQDADLEYDPLDYKKLLECALKNNAKVVYGSRRMGSEKKFSHWYYYLGGLFLNWVTNIICGTNITDESTCYKFFKTDFLKSIPLESERFEFCPEVTVKIAKRGVKIYEVPIKYFPRHINEGKKIRWKDGLIALWTLIKYKFVD